jgi:guanylate kinase
MVARQSFLESAEVHGNRYGTSREGIERCIREGDDVILEIDFQGALQVRQQFDNANLIFILPPSWEELRARLMRRGEDSPEVIDKRLANAKLEMAQAGKFDFVIINELFERALFDLKAIVHAQRLRYAAQRQARDDVFSGLGLP